MKSNPKPPAQVCKLCGHDDGVEINALSTPGVWTFECSNIGKHHADVYRWEVPIQSDLQEGRSGITQELGLYDDLPKCLVPGEAWVEHGIVEHRYKVTFPKVYFGELLPRYGHRALDPKPYTLSAFIASALGQLAREGVIAQSSAPATGYWRYNGTVSYWATAPPPPESDRLTWESFAADALLDADTWSLEPRDR